MEHQKGRFAMSANQDNTMTVAPCHSITLTPSLPGRQRRRRIAAALGLAAVVSLGGGRAARACLDFDPIIFDPANYAQAVQQVAQIIHQVQQAEQAVQNGLQMAANWGYTQLAGISQAVHRVTGVLDESDAYRSDPASDLGDRYPTDYGAAPSSDDFASRQAAWNDAERQALVENRNLQNQAAQDVAPAAARIAGLVEASNQSAGETAAAQARTEILAETSTELAKLQALKLARGRLRVEREARRQSEQAYGEAQRRRLMRDWDQPVAAEPVPMPFGG
jgi:P-type conjugative transfer protein TrbJ